MRNRKLLIVAFVLALVVVVTVGSLAFARPKPGPGPFPDPGPGPGKCPNAGLECLDIWDPVTCDNGVTYSNQCYADRACATGCVEGGARQ